MAQSFLTISILLKAFMSCNNWENGLADVLNESEEYCKIKKPQLCWPVFIDDILNLSKDIECNNSDKINIEQQIENTLIAYKILNQQTMTQQQIDEIKQTTKYIGWPLNNKFKWEHQIDERNIVENLIQNIKLYENKDQAIQDGKEVIIDVQNQNVIFNVQRDINLIEKRQNQFKNKGIENKSMSQNIIMIYIDTLSRAHFLRKLKKTSQFLENRIYLENNYDSQSFEFFRYHSVDKNTIDNVSRLRYDIISEDYQKEKKTFDQNNLKRSLFNDIKDAGYIMGHSTNTMSIKSGLRGQYYKNQQLYKYFEDDTADHEMLMFDPQYMHIPDGFGHTKGADSLYRRCLYGQDTNKYVFEYAEQFLEVYSEDKKFLLLEFTDGHEITGEVVQYLDENLSKFLQNIENKGFLSKDTIVYMLADHGQHRMTTYQPFEMFYFDKKTANDSYTIERMLPFFFMIMTKDIFQNYEDLERIVEKNSQKIFGMVEVRNTILKNAFGIDYYLNNYSNNNQLNLFEQLPINRTCLDINMAPQKNILQYCSCLPQEGIEQGLKNRKLN